MHLSERIAKRVRHARGLDNADALWRLVRPAYDKSLATLTRGRGLKRNINGSGNIRIVLGCRPFVSETHEPEVWHFLTRMVKPGDTIADVGAHIGLYTIALAKRTGVTGRVFAFEPDPETRAMLAGNIHCNGLENRVSIISGAVGAICGEVPFAAGRGSTSHVLATGGEAASITVPLVTLDSIFSHGRLDLIKIDVEGFEEQVVRGASKLLSDRQRRPRLLLIEVHPFAWEGVAAGGDSLLSLLNEYGYATSSLEGVPIERIESYGHIVAGPAS